MTAEEAWKELTEKFPYIVEDNCNPIYFWEPDVNTPVSIHHKPEDHAAGWRWTTFAEDIPLAFLVVKTFDAIGQVIVWAKWSRQGWSANPHVRHLVRHLIDELRDMYSGVAMDCQFVAGLKAGWNAAQSDHPEDKYQEIMRAYENRLSGKRREAALTMVTVES